MLQIEVTFELPLKKHQWCGEGELLRQGSLMADNQRLQSAGIARSECSAGL